MGGKLEAVFAPTTRYMLTGQLRAWSWPGLATVDAEFVTSNLSRWAEGAATPARLRVTFRQRGITWLVAYEPGTGTLGELAPGPGGWTPRSRGVARAFAARYAEWRDRAVSPTGGYSLWRLAPRPHTARPRWTGPQRLPPV
jgi:hypothetical protein